MWLRELARKVRGIFGPGTVTGLEAFEFDTATTPGELDPKIAVGQIIAMDRGSFVKGWYTGARQWPIHVKRLGGTIAPRVTVVHTTDMAPGTMAALLKRWAEVPGEGAGAHFVIGKQAAGQESRVPTGGVVQLAPINRNGNHAGGSKLIDGKRVPSHGWFRTPAGKLLHPNSYAVGIELDNAGKLARQDGVWVHKDSGKVIPSSDVFLDARGRGWERVTDYQLLALGALLDALDATLERFEAGVTIVPNGSYAANGVPEASLPWVREVGHWTLDPTRKTDPGPQVDAWLELRARAI